MRKLYPLTPEERAFAEEKYPLVDKFLSMKRLDPDEWFDVVIFGFLEAVQVFIRQPERQIYDFTPFAITVMKHSVGKEWKYRTRAIRAETPLSLDASHPDLESVSDFYTIIPDRKQNIEQQIENRDLIERVMGVGTKRQVEAIGYVCMGYEPCEVSKIMHITRDTTRTTLLNFRNRARAVRDNREVIKCPHKKSKVAVQKG